MHLYDGLVSADLFVGLQDTTVEVYENEGPARVCAFIQGNCYPFTPFHIRVFTEDDSAGMNGPCIIASVDDGTDARIMQYIFNASKLTN